MHLIKALVKYIELMHILKPCTENILDNLLQLYEFYVYCVFLAYTPMEYQQKLLQSYGLEKSVEFERIFSMYRLKSMQCM